MGQKTNPNGFRYGVYKNWQSIWFTQDKKVLPAYVLEDQKIRRFLMKRLSGAGISQVVIERSFGNIKIVVAISRPGVVIGKGGAGIALLREELKKLTPEKVDLVVEEIKEIEKSAYLTARAIADQIEKRIPYKRAVNSALQKAQEARVLGIKIEVSGLLSGASSIGRNEKFSRGTVPTQTLRADIDFARVEAMPAYGSIGIKVWIYRGEYENIK
ncbi:30S ribosomal protein S3 [Candidatus Parcubacteria bacterium]|nr:30S ribosomal protein S3 [Patescibacteria group bacterium]MBU4381146.1 30S ribosomal protein S3 [Patescibacteria group bacterium]MCG2689131.1 30S ribosomal protein S3 [Candidatus Parcubacteria bacterium]